jgi:hypothetical protein
MSEARRRSLPCRAVILIAVGMFLTGCSGSSGTSASTAGGTASSASSDPSTAPATHRVKPPPAAPAVAECRTLTYRDILVFFNDSKTTSCTGAHTAYTFAVVQLPDRVAFTGVKIQNKAVLTTAADKCHAAFRKFVGGDDESRALARLTVTYFLPRQIGFDLGAHWVRCDVVAMKTAKSLADLPNRLQGFLDSPGALASYGVCSRGDPGSSPLVMCSEPHAYRALAAIRLGGLATSYPGVNSTVNLGTRRCKALVAKQLGVSGGFTYSWTYPSTTDWMAGQRFGYCWNATTS